MAYRKRTLRKMLPITRKVARLIGELSSVERRLKNVLAEIKQIEFEAEALKNGQAPQPKAKEEPSPKVR